eukprot:3671205-Alexandrium_andersonii.AAC.1
MSASLVGSEMCIRDSPCTACQQDRVSRGCEIQRGAALRRAARDALDVVCLLYTSDAADDM